MQKTRTADRPPDPALAAAHEQAERRRKRRRRLVELLAIVAAWVFSAALVLAMCIMTLRVVLGDHSPW